MGNMAYHFVAFFILVPNLILPIKLIKNDKLALNTLMINELVFFSVNGQWRYFRSCAYLGEPGIGGDERYCLMRSGTYNIFMEYCTCNSKDGCNSASSVSLSWFLIPTAVLASIFKRLF